MRNALAGETSPYLLQHAHNPVQWYPWRSEALERAKSENKPILLSIGYSACHWCHVMAHESFQHDDTAVLMNELFVNIKVDREERPDLDKIYQLSHQLLTQRPGGWPLTVFLTPDTHEPYFAGTYFPLQQRYGMPSFQQVLTQMEQVYRTRTEDIRRQNQSLREALASLEPKQSSAERIDERPLLAARQQLERSFESRHGGFGGAPKFPHCTNIERLLRHYAMSARRGTADERALEMAAFTLEKMTQGGLYDQIGGGYCRYSVDDQWMIPHFEKMLYDNGPLLALCAEMFQVTGNTLFETAAKETAAWVMREMQSPSGGYYSTLDADSEGVEGKYYVWTPEQVETLLDAQSYELVAKRFGLDRAPNFEGEHWHLHGFRELEDVASEMKLAPSKARTMLDAARALLFEAREHRIRPGLDDKILTSWNALMIKGMGTAGRVLGDEVMIDSAYAALDYVRKTLWQDGRLLATSKGEHAHLAAYLDDYAFMIDAVLSLLQARWRDGDLEFACSLTEVLMEQFEDQSLGGFFFTAHDHEELVHRHKPLSDDAVPSGNAIAAHALARLGHLLGETRYLDAAERAIRVAWDGLSRAPHAFTAMLLAVEEHIVPTQTVVIRGRNGTIEEWHRECAKAYVPWRMCFAIPSNADALPGLLDTRAPRGEITAYVCNGVSCGPPCATFEDLQIALDTNVAESSLHQ